ncbi:MAG: hypothetical protein GWO04_37565, partial [Actinobacteria bacterium]|nr:hypothetical protein [Actinomycetota bacterium]NIS35306.1 hypothetical protein [Actinomycetota bacterium]
MELPVLGTEHCGQPAPARPRTEVEPAGDVPVGDGPMHDSFGRRIEYLRISVTDKCNLRCV